MSNGPLPRELKRAFRYKEWGLPEPGGVDDQPAGLLDFCDMLMNVYQSFTSYKAASGDTVPWTVRHPDMWNVVSSVIAMKRAMKNGG